VGKLTTKTGGYSDLPGDIRVERVFDKRKLVGVTVFENDGAFVLAVERVSNCEDPSILSGSVKFPQGWPWGKGLTVSLVIVNDAHRYLAFRCLERAMTELES
jgi:hypothetical protein